MATKKPRITVIDSQEALEALIKTLSSLDSFACNIETTDFDAFHTPIVGIAISPSGEEGYYIPTGHTAGKNLPIQTVAKTLQSVLEETSIQKIGHDIKYDIEVLRTYGVDMINVVDTMLLGYLLRKGIIERTLDVESLAKYELHMTLPALEALLGPKGKKRKLFSDLPIEMAAEYTAEKTAAIYRLYPVLKQQIKEEDLESVLQTIEQPLIHILADIETSGIKVDVDLLANMSVTLGATIQGLCTDIYAITGEECNLNSPKQLSEILFNKLKIPTKGIKRTKTMFSTATTELEKIDHPIAVKLIEYRELGKLKGTYVDALPKLAHPDNHRVHTTFDQGLTATGRLSSRNPNLQNIPIRTAQGREVRKAFIAEKGHVFVSADYSQIELRVLAHLSQEPELIAAFNSGTDIHAITASIVQKVPLDTVTAEMRRAAKVVNFGILYGLGPQRLTRETDMTIEEAKAFIDAYFTGYPLVQKWIEDTKQQAHAQGYVSSLFGRKRYIPELAAPEEYLRAAGERMAVNMPIQGTAADIMKLSMIAVYNALHSQKLQAKILLQVHDELVLEVPTKEVAAVVALLKKEMPAVAKLAVPLDVEVKTGKNWGEMELVK